MKPSERALFILNKFRDVEFEMSSFAGFSYGTTYLPFDASLQCAHILVDEMIASSQGADYYLQVKIELNKIK